MDKWADFRYLVCRKFGKPKYLTFNFMTQKYYFDENIKTASKCATVETAEDMIKAYQKASGDKQEVKIVKIRVTYEVLDE